MKLSFGKLKTTATKALGIGASLLMPACAAESLTPQMPDTQAMIMADQLPMKIHRVEEGIRQKLTLLGHIADTTKDSNGDYTVPALRIIMDCTDEAIIGASSSDKATIRQVRFAVWDHPFYQSCIATGAKEEVCFKTTVAEELPVTQKADYYATVLNSKNREYVCYQQFLEQYSTK
jgi:hypothetical protein